MMQFYPLPNTEGTADGVNNYTDPDANGNDYNFYTGRVDHVLSSTNRLYGSVTVLEQRDYSLQSFHNIAKGNRLHRIQRGIALNDVWILRPTLLVDLRYGLTRYGNHNYPPSLGYDLSQLGLPAAVTSQLDRTFTTVPETSITGYTTLGHGSGSTVVTNYHTYLAHATNIRGNHSLRFGGEFRVMQENRYSWGYVSPFFTFTTEWTQGPLDNSPAAPMGQGLAAFLLGTLSGGGIDRNASVAESSHYWGFFFHDDWKVSSRLTLTLGLRYELDLPIKERFDRSIRNFDYAMALPFAAAAQAAYAASPIAEVPPSAFRTVGGLLYAGVGGVPRSLWNPDRNNFSPRLGLAWRWRPQTVVRAGYGVFFEPGGSDRYTASPVGYSRRTPITPRVDNGLTFRATPHNPFPDGILNPEGAAMGYRASLGGTASYFEPNLRAGYNQRWSLGVQHEFPHRVLLETGYVGNRALGLGVTRFYNPVPAQYLSTLNSRNQRTIDHLSQAVNNPFFRLSGWEGAGLQTRTTTRAQLLRPYPHFTGVNAADRSGYTWCHSLQVRAEKRFSHGYTLEAAYTWSKLMEAVSRMNETDPLPYEVISSIDRTHVLALSGIYELPFGRGKRLLSSGYWTNLVAGGWQLQAMYQAQTGPPIDFGNIFFYGDIKNINIPSGQRTVERWFNVDAGFERDPARQPAYNLRAFPFRFSGIRADGFNNWNLSVIKTFKLTERAGLEFRAEAVDAMNTPTFAPPTPRPPAPLSGRSPHCATTAPSAASLSSGRSTSEFHSHCLIREDVCPGPAPNSTAPSRASRRI